MATLGGELAADLQNQVLTEFEDELRAGRVPFMCGDEFARGLLTHALGEVAATRCGHVWAPPGDLPSRPWKEPIRSRQHPIWVGNIRRP